MRTSAICKIAIACAAGLFFLLMIWSNEGPEDMARFQFALSSWMDVVGIGDLLMLNGIRL